MSIERGKSAGYRRSQAGLVAAALFLSAALLLALQHQTHLPVAVHGLVVIALFCVAMLLFFTARGRSSDGNPSGGDTGKSEGSSHGS
jgi:hypothetical protein